MPRCPGQDMRYWTSKDIFDVPCVHCGTAIEFWKDEPSRPCPGCGRDVRNPRLDLGCAEWCKYAPECLGQDGGAPVVPVIDRLQSLLDGYFVADPAARQRARRCLDRAEQSPLAPGVDPCVVRAGALLAGALVGRRPSGSADPGTFQAMLERAGIGAPVARHMCDLVRMILEGNRDGSPECEVILAAVKPEQARDPHPGAAHPGGGSVDPDE
jgi:hypothetical protein